MIEFVSLDRIDPNPFQPREEMDPAALAELAADILARRAQVPETMGLLQTPRARRHRSRIQLAYGHRRLAAFQLLREQGHREYSELPVELAEFSDVDMATIAWSENTAREDINLIEEAHFIRRLIDEFGWSLKDAGKHLGIAFGTISNIVRLTRLPEDIQQMVARGQIPQSRAYELVSLLERVSPDELRQLVQSAAQQNSRGWKKHVKEARQATETGVDLAVTVVEPAARALAEGLRQDEPGAWLIVARAIDSKVEDVDGAEALARLIVERATLKSITSHNGRKRVNEMFTNAGLETPWNAAALGKVTQFLTWQQKKKRARSA